MPVVPRQPPQAAAVVPKPVPVSFDPGKDLGPSFGSEIAAVSLQGKALSWSKRLVMYMRQVDEPNGLTDTDITNLQGVIAGHNAANPAPPTPKDDLRVLLESLASTTGILDRGVLKPFFVALKKVVAST